MNRQKLKARIVLTGKKISDVLEDLNISKTAWYRKLSGISVFTLDEIKRIAIYLQLDEEEIIAIFFDDAVSCTKNESVALLCPSSIEYVKKGVIP